MSGNCGCEMTLDEWVERLPEIHRARKEYAALKDKVEKFTSTNSAMDAIELLVEIVNAFSGDTARNYSMRLLGVMDRARDFVVAQQHQ